MLNVFKRSCRSFRKTKLETIFQDIVLFNSYVKEYVQYSGDNELDVWYFENVFCNDYVAFLKHYPRLSASAQKRLHEGVMSILIFKLYQFAKGNIEALNVNTEKTTHALRKIKFTDKTTIQLRFMTYDAIEKAKRRKYYSSKELDETFHTKLKWMLSHMLQ